LGISGSLWGLSFEAAGNKKALKTAKFAILRAF